jgi:hypothetical protein
LEALGPLATSAQAPGDGTHSIEPPIEVRRPPKLIGQLRVLLANTPHERRKLPHDFPRADIHILVLQNQGQAAWKECSVSVSAMNAVLFLGCSWRIL